MVDREELHRGVLVQEVVEDLGAERERRHHLAWCRALPCSGHHAALDEVDERVREQLGVDTEVLVVDQAGQQRVGDGADAHLDGGTVADARGDVGGDALVDGRRGRRLDLDQRPVDCHPAGHLTAVDLVATERPRHALVHLEEERHLPDERSDVVAAGAEGEVPVAVHRCGGGEDQRALGGLSEQPGHLAEVVGHELAAPAVKGRARHRRQEVRHVEQVLPHAPVQVRAVVQGVHLVDPHPGPAGGVGFDGVDHADRLAVGERHDQVGPVRDELEDVFELPRSHRLPASRCRAAGGHVARRAGPRRPPPPCAGSSRAWRTCSTRSSSPSSPRGTSARRSAGW